MASQDLDHRDIDAYLRLKKQREETFLRMHLPPSSMEDPPLFRRRLQELDRDLLALECKFTMLGMKLVLPHEKSLEETNQLLQGSPPEDVAQAIRSRDGPLYARIKARWQMVLSHLENRDSITKINLLLRRLGYDRCTRLVGALRLGTVNQPIDLSPFSGPDRRWIVLLLQRLDLPVALDNDTLTPGPLPGTHQKIIYNGMRVWLPAEEVRRLEQLLEEIQSVSRRLQSYTAQRQAHLFSAEQERDFEETQLRYLHLVRERDALVQPFYEENRFFVEPDAVRNDS